MTETIQESEEDISMETKRRTRAELDAYLDGYNAAVSDFIECINKSANTKNRAHAAIQLMLEKRDFLNNTLGFNRNAREI